MTRIRAIRHKTPGEVAAALDRFAPRYLKDWDDWLAVPAARVWTVRLSFPSSRTSRVRSVGRRDKGNQSRIRGPSGGDA